MKLKHYELICLIVTLFMGYEYAVYNRIIESESYVQKIASTLAPSYVINLNPTAGYPLSYFLGWLGFSFILAMNVYSLRKRFSLFNKMGKLPGWLEFHIFCGIIGPIFIIFHTNFKVNGLVSISFWSMVITASSGIVGRYFYIQTLKKKEEIKKYIEVLKNQFKAKHKTRFTDDKFEEIFQHTYITTGVGENVTNPLVVFATSLKADFHLFFTNPGKPFGLSKVDGEFLKKLGVENRRASLLEPFKQLLGYWHSFHLPFAFFMYVVAVIHIIVALLFGVKH